MVLQHNALCDGKAKTRAADFLGPGFVDAVESVVYFVKRVLRNADSGVLDADIEIVGIRVDRNSHFAVVPVVLDRILNEIGDDHVHLHLIDLRIDIPDTHHRKFDVPFLRDRPDSSKHKLDHLIDVYFFDIELGVLAVHPDEGQKLRDDLVLPVHLVFDIDHKLAVHLDRNVVLLHEGIRQHFHRSHGRLQLMRDVGHKLLP